MHAAVNYAALSPLQLPLPYLPPPSPPPPLPLPPPVPLLSPPLSPASLGAGSQLSRISPSILLVILILAVIFFVSGLLHLLVRFLFHPAPRDPYDGGDADGNATAFQGQLQQLFHLHDAGVDQSFIDALPVFLYGAVVGGGKDPFDCAVCLCEFDGDDRLRLLPTCSHAFHVECIDTWLLSHSTCPLCRRSLLADFSPCGGGCMVVESGSEGSVVDGASSAANISVVMEQDEGCEREKHADVKNKEEVVVPVKLGKFRSQLGSEAGEQGVRRCYSMGTYEYVMDQSSLLHVSVKPPAKKTRMAGHGVAVSECDCHSTRRECLDASAKVWKPRMEEQTESFSISKIWMRNRKEGGSLSRRVSSFRLPSALQRAASDIGAPKLRADVVSPVTESEYNVSASASGSVVDWDLESGSAAGLRSRADEAPSFARRTLLWIRGHL